MELEHDFTVPVPVEQAWDVLLDIERIAPCMPGATVTKVEGDSFEGNVKVKVGPITVTYGGTARFADKDQAARRAVIEASAKETRGSGTAKATVTATLHEENASSTKVKVRTDLAITGKPAQFGRGVMADVGNKLIGRFADCLAEEIRSGPAPGAEATSTGTGAGGGGTAAQDARGDAAPLVDATGTTATTAPTQGAPAPTGGTGPSPVAAAAPAAAAPAAAPTAPATSATSATTPAPRAATPRRTAEAIDLFDAAGAPVLKRVAPVAGGAVGVVLLLWLLRKVLGG